MFYSSGNGAEMTNVKEHALSDTNPVQRVHSKPHNHSLAQNLISSNKSKAKFKNWLKTKQSNTDSEGDAGDIEQSTRNTRDVSYNSDRYSQNNYNDMPYRDHQGSGNVNILRVPSTRSPEFATPDTGWNSDDETGEISAAQLLSPDNFDARADDIIGNFTGCHSCYMHFVADTKSLNWFIPCSVRVISSSSSSYRRASMPW